MICCARRSPVARHDVAANLERQELRAQLERAGLAEILAAVADPDVCFQLPDPIRRRTYQRCGRPAKDGLSIVKVARKLGRHPSYVRRALERARRIMQTAA